MIWLDPRPIPEDIHLAYQEYYTHAIYRAGAKRSWKLRLVDLWVLLVGLREERRFRKTAMLGNESPGKVLDLGCGNGGQLHMLRELGWQPQGQELDPKSAAVVERELGIPVFLGPIEGAPFSAESFDAVISSHVFEHVHDPEAFLRSAWRLVKPGGMLFIAMPNARAWSYNEVFGSNWVGLDPPRHLRIFSPLALVTLAHKIGIETPVVTSAIADVESFVQGSIQVARHRGLVGDTLRNKWLLHGALYYSTMVVLHHRLSPLSGEELILRARKPLH
jgi:2-polyprenyl-3-methyl-5-hydroxy-6-metoxy-1,4-benzoquinol methylase